jgi:Ni/Fe-hydrogenase subunit HybB-like protein
MSVKSEAGAPVGGKLATPAFRVLAGLFAAAMLAIAWRFAFGVGSVTAMTDGHPWGAWKVFNVIVLTALASGGYATALLAYVLNRGRYHSLVRLAVLTSAVGYTSGVLSLGVDIGRPWNFWRLVVVTGWNLHSVLLEVAICISAYVVFLWLEVAPLLLDRWTGSPREWLRRRARAITPWLERAFPFIVAFAVVLPTMHQSSLGSLFLLAGPRLHALWQTPALPLFFLISAWFMGYAAVTAASLLCSLAFDRRRHVAVLAAMGRINGGLVLFFVAGRWADVALRGQLGAVAALDRFGALFLAEAALLAPAALMLVRPRRGAGALLALAMSIALGGALYRLDAALVGFMPGPGWRYFPSLLELLVTAGWVAAALATFLYVVRRFPVLDAPLARGARTEGGCS